MVAPIDPSHLLVPYQVRGALDRLAARLAAATPSTPTPDTAAPKRGADTVYASDPVRINRPEAQDRMGVDGLSDDWRSDDER